MSSQHQKALKSARCELLNNVIVSELLLSHLISNRIITPNMKSEVDVSMRQCLGNVMVRALYQYSRRLIVDMFIVTTRVPQSPSSIIWYWPNGDKEVTVEVLSDTQWYIFTYRLLIRNELPCLRHSYDTFIFSLICSNNLFMSFYAAACREGTVSFAFVRLSVRRVRSE